MTEGSDLGMLCADVASPAYNQHDMFGKSLNTGSAVPCDVM